MCLSSSLRRFGNGRPRIPGFRHTVAAADLILDAEPVITPTETPPQRAARFQAMLDTGQGRNRADVARLMGCSRAAVTKVLESGAE